jgi:ankyrin repeat protein
MLSKGADANALTGPSRITWVTEANFGFPPPPVPPTPPLFLAAANGHAEAMQALLAAGADPHFVAANGSNLIMAAAKGRSAAALELALSLTPDPNHADSKGETALHILAGGTASPDLAAMLQAMAAHGARADIPDAKGYTAAHFAVNGRSEVKALFVALFPAASAYAAAHPVQKS